MIYEHPGENDPVTQGDVLDDCPLLAWEMRDPGDEPIPGDTEGCVVILTQACDMAQEKANRVLVAVVHSARYLVDTGVLRGKTVRDHVRAHRVYGWYFLPASGLMAESLVELRNLHTLPRVMLGKLVREGRRVCRIATPYREHMAQHFSTTYSRIALPEPYPSEPE